MTDYGMLPVPHATRSAVKLKQLAVASGAQSPWLLGNYPMSYPLPRLRALRQPLAPTSGNTG